MVAPVDAQPDDGLPIGSLIDGRYRIDAVLGSGGMGRVYRAEHVSIGRAVAIKVLHPSLHRNREAAGRFQREAMASGRLDHPNIIAVSDFGVLDDGSCYLVMEMLEGESLGERLLREPRIGWRDALAILGGVMQGLQHAHERGVVHRDIKPDNIFLTRKDGHQVIKILDFGIAKLYAGSPDDPVATRAGLTVGTPAYLSPEQAVGGEITPASDIYSSSIVLYEILVGRAPFEDTDPLAMLGAHVSRPPPPFAEVAPDLAGVIPREVEQLVMRGLAKDPNQRGTSERVIDDLTKLLSEPSEPPARAASEPAPVSEPTNSEVERAQRAVSLADIDPVPRSWTRNAAIVVGVLGAITLVLALVLRDSKATGSNKDSGAGGGGAKRSEPVKPKRPSDRTLLNAALYELTSGKDCAVRRAAVAKLADLGDPEAIGPLEAARKRPRGGPGGALINDNDCIAKDIEAAITKLKKR